MVLRTYLERYLQKDISSFNYNGWLYTVNKIDDKLKLVFATTNIFDADETKVGIYSVKQKGFVFVFRKNRDWDILLDPIDKNELSKVDDYTSFTLNLKKAIQSEFVNAASFEAKRTIKNDKMDIDYLRKVKETAEKYFLKGETIDMSYDLSIINSIQFSEIQLLSALNDFYDTAYDIAEKMIEENEKYSYEYFFKKDVFDKVEELKKNDKTELAAKARINEIKNNPDYHSLSVIVSNYKNSIDDKKINVKVENLSLIPLYSIKSISWRKKSLYEKTNYIINTPTVDDWLSADIHRYSIYPIFDFIPQTVLSDENACIKLIAAGYNVSNIPKHFLNDKIFILKAFDILNSNMKSSLYNNLNYTLKTDVDILNQVFKYVDTLSLSLNEIPMKVYENKDFMKEIMKEGNILKTNYIVSKNPLLFDDKDILDVFKNNFNFGTRHILSDEIIKKLNDHNFTLDLLKNKNIIFGQIHLLSSDILNDERIWDVILERSKHEYGKVPHILIFNKLNDVSKHNLKIMHGLFLLSSVSAEQTIISTIGMNAFHKWKDLQIACIQDNKYFLDYVSDDVKINALKNLCKIDPYKTYTIIRNEKFSEDEVLDFVRINPQILIYSSKQYSLHFYKTLLDEDTRYANYFSTYIYNNADIVNLITDYISVILKLRVESKLLLNKDIILRSLKHNFSDFTNIPKGCSGNGYQTILESKEFLIDAFKLNISDKEREEAFIYLLDVKSHAVKDPDVLSIILSDDFSLLEYCKRSIYNDKDLMMNVIPKTKTSKVMVRTILENLNSKLIKDKDILALL